MKKAEKFNQAKTFFSNQKINGMFMCFVLLVFQTRMNAQDTLSTNQPSGHKWFVSVSSGYSWPGANDVLGNRATHDSNNNTRTQTTIRGTYGTGSVNELKIGYMLNPHIGFELGGFANWGKEIMIVEQYFSIIGNYVGQTIKINSQGLLAGICLKETFPKFELSLHNDFILGTNYKAFDYVIQEINTDTYEDYWEYTGGIGYGWKGNISLAYSLKPKFSIGLNAFFSVHSWSPNEGTLVRHDVNGNDELASVPIENRSVKYDDMVTYSTVSGFPPGVAFKKNYPLHSAGATIFIAFRF